MAEGSSSRLLQIQTKEPIDVLWQKNHSRAAFCNRGASLVGAAISWPARSWTARNKTAHQSSRSRNIRKRI
jgi:hypothetical protein